jgi:transcriptional regulator with XRE-family HTH domain
MPERNERLRKAIAESQLTIEELADAVGVSAKSVNRWLGGQTPYPRHRWGVAKKLNKDERDLWPEADLPVAPGRASTSEIMMAYAHRADAPKELWWNLLVNANRQIDLFAYAMLFLPEAHPKLIDVLRGKAATGCKIRIAFADPNAEDTRRRDAEEGLNGGLIARINTAIKYFNGVRNCEGIEVRSYAAPMYNSVFRFDDEMLVTPHLYEQPGSRSPLMHLRRLGSDGLFDTFASHIEAIWAIGQPVDWGCEPSRVLQRSEGAEGEQLGAGGLSGRH